MGSFPLYADSRLVFKGVSVKGQFGKGKKKLPQKLPYKHAHTSTRQRIQAKEKTLETLNFKGFAYFSILLIIGFGGGGGN
ncbi:MAG: hypothetical protein Q4A49_00845 [Neisseria sp.]|nr:hypothetical protein [Neisseria sp.]